MWGEFFRGVTWDCIFRQNFQIFVKIFDSNELRKWRNFYQSFDITVGQPHSCILNFLDDKQNQLIFTKKKLFIRNSSRKILFVVHSCLVEGKFFKCWSTFYVNVKAVKETNFVISIECLQTFFLFLLWYFIIKWWLNLLVVHSQLICRLYT